LRHGLSLLRGRQPGRQRSGSALSGWQVRGVRGGGGSCRHATRPHSPQPTPAAADR
jgi:hypothetical protein